MFGIKKTKTNMTGKERQPVQPSYTMDFLKSCSDEGGDVDVSRFEQFFGSLGLDLASIDPFIFFWKMGVTGCCGLRRRMS